MKRAVVVLLLFFAGCPAARADLPVRVEQLIYSLSAFNGGDYSATFALQTADTLYLLAGTDNLLSVRKTLVYWWPLTSEWKTDSDSLNEPLTGTLEITGPGGSVRKLDPRRAVLFSVPGARGPQWRLLTGPDADREVARARQVNDAYFAAVTDYQEKTKEYDAEVESLGAQIAELKRRGRDASAVAARLEALAHPVAPSAPDAYATPPDQVEEAFIVNLPVGRYSVRLLAPGDGVFEGSDKSIVVYAQRRRGSIGYEVIPGDKWTRPEESKTPASVLYVNGSTDLYLRPFIEDEVNDLFYQKTVSNQSTGNPSLYQWVRLQEVPGAEIEMTGRGSPSSRVAERPFIVNQSTGTALGYTIAPFDQETAGPGQSPSILACPVPMGKGVGMVRLRAFDADGHVMAGSERQIRVVRRPPAARLLALLSLVPLLALGMVLVLRARSNRP